MAINPDREMLKKLYQPSKNEFSLVDVPDMPFLTIDGEGSPENETFAKSVKWIWTAVHPLRVMAKQRMGRAFVEPPLECLWWADDMDDFIGGNKDQWKWRLMITTPLWAREQMYSSALEQASNKLGEAPKSLQLRTFKEGLCAQILHIGPGEGQAQTVAKLHKEYLPQNNLQATGPHHEIYLNDVTRIAPEKWKTVLRQPVRGVG